MKYRFEVYQTKVEEHVFWVAESKELKGCVGQGDSMDSAIRELEMNEIAWLETAKEVGIEIPVPSDLNNYEFKSPSTAWVVCENSCNETYPKDKE